MSYADLEAARRHHAALKLVIARHAGEAADPRALRRVVDLCRSFSEAVDDEYCSEKIRLVAEYAAEMLSYSEHRKWNRAATSGADFLKQQIANALELLDSRLYSMAVIRRAAACSYIGPEALLPRW